MSSWRRRWGTGYKTQHRGVMDRGKGGHSGDWEETAREAGGPVSLGKVMDARKRGPGTHITNWNTEYTKDTCNCEWWNIWLMKNIDFAPCLCDSTGSTQGTQVESRVGPKRCLASLGCHHPHQGCYWSQASISSLLHQVAHSLSHWGCLDTPGSTAFLVPSFPVVFFVVVWCFLGKGQA